MALPSAGNSISISQVNTELAASSNTSRNMNNTNLRTLFQKTTAGSQIKMSDGSGKSFVFATGGTKTTSGLYTIHTFASSDSFVVNYGSINVDFLIVSGGGGGGGDRGGGGGGGGVYKKSSVSC